MADVFLYVGVFTTAFFFAVFTVDGALRVGYDPKYHAVSELTLGGRGWIQRANFLQMGVGMFVFAFGTAEALDSIIGPVFITVFGLGLVVSGLFIPDRVRGYPPGSPTTAADNLTVHHQIHSTAGPITFLAALGACLTTAFQLQGGWRIYTLVTAAVGLAMTAWTARSFQKDGQNLGLVQRGLILVYWTWIVLLGLHLAGPS